MPKITPSTQVALFTLCLGIACACAVQAAEPPVLRNAEVTESSIIDALAVEPAEAGSGRTRGFKPAVPGAAAPAAAPPKAGPGKANLLIVFTTGSATLTPESRTALDVVARAMQSDALAGLTFRVEGHADARGDSDVNLKLSQARAESVVAYLVSQHAILPERLTPQGKGSVEPMNKERIDAPENRRVAIVTIRG
ncbi:MAG: OmpA family protein [Chitinophagaceae bacterium]|nr:OmpA family protein [Rubrivivax sp.]